MTSAHKKTPSLCGFETQIGSHNGRYYTRTHTHGAQALSHILIRFHGNPDWDHIACPSICSVLTCVVFVFFFVCVCVCVFLVNI